MTTAIAKNDLIMFYGSLQRGEYPHISLKLSAKLEFVDNCTITGNLFDMGQYPACVQGEGVVHGELFKVTDSTVLETLDHFERYDAGNLQQSLYIREKVSLISPAKYAIDNINVWTYIYNQELINNIAIHHGHWLNYKQETNNNSDFKGF
ncbi:MAG: gamma-glutamylcyclotransferase family protein [Oceanospirillaceae bacterium]